MTVKDSQPRALRFKTGKVRVVASRVGAAAETIGSLERGVHVSAVTAGQFSAIDALEHIAREAGEADIAISTWTTGVYDIERAAKLRENGDIRRVRVLLDRSTFEKSPQYAGPLIEALGVGAFRCAAVHAKVIVIKGVKFSAAFRSSMNLNKNLRTEQLDVGCDDDLAKFYWDWFDRLWVASAEQQDNEAIMAAVYDRWRELPSDLRHRPGDLASLVL